MKKIRNITLVVSVFGICVFNMLTFFGERQNADLSLNQLVKMNTAWASEGIDPNDHYGYYKDFSRNCCAQSANHSDICKGKFC